MADRNRRERRPVDLNQLHKAGAAGLCFICEFLKGNPAYDHVLIAETETAVAFLNKYPTLFGATLVAPKRHVEQVTGDFSEREYLALQGFLYRTAEAIRRVLAPERLYILSLGSQTANAHVHWHVAPLPPGVPLAEQQYHALMHEHGVVDVSERELRDLATRIRAALAP